jgi:hypothetical protein
VETGRHAVRPADQGGRRPAALARRGWTPAADAPRRGPCGRGLDAHRASRLAQRRELASGSSASRSRRLGQRGARTLSARRAEAGAGIQAPLRDAASAHPRRAPGRGGERALLGRAELRSLCSTWNTREPAAVERPSIGCAKPPVAASWRRLAALARASSCGRGPARNFPLSPIGGEGWGEGAWRRLATRSVAQAGVPRRPGSSELLRPWSCQKLPPLPHRGRGPGRGAVETARHPLSRSGGRASPPWLERTLAAAVLPETSPLPHRGRGPGRGGVDASRHAIDRSGGRRPAALTRRGWTPAADAPRRDPCGRGLDARRASRPTGRRGLASGPSASRSRRLRQRGARTLPARRAEAVTDFQAPLRDAASAHPRRAPGRGGGRALLGRAADVPRGTSKDIEALDAVPADDPAPLGA